jgi:hypothetical protein
MDIGKSQKGKESINQPLIYISGLRLNVLHLLTSERQRFIHSEKHMLYRLLSQRWEVGHLKIA